MKMNAGVCYMLIGLILNGCSLEIQSNYYIKISKMKKVETEGLKNSDLVELENKEIKKVTQVENTPFDIVEIDEKYFVALGKYRLTELLSTETEAKAYIDNKEWNLLLAVISSIVTQTISTNNQIDEMVKNQQDYEKKTGNKRTIN